MRPLSRTVADQIEVPVESDAKAGLQFCKAVAQVCVKMLDDGASFSNGSCLPRSVVTHAKPALISHHNTG